MLIDFLRQFINTLHPAITNSRLAIAVSGGADSMALSLGLKELSTTCNLQLTALTVDHQLRANSAAEAQQVHDWLTIHGIQHEILTWRHEQIRTRIQENARNARYKLLSDYCKNHHIEYLFLGHHLNDQFETFMMRLTHESGLKGLTCMSAISYQYGLTLVRPLLKTPSQDLKNYLVSQNQAWIEDPSNTFDCYERIRWRQHSEVLEKIGINAEVISTICDKLRLDNEALDWNVSDWIRQNADYNPHLKFITCNPSLRTLPSSIAKRIMLCLASSVRKKEITAAELRHNMDHPYRLLTLRPFKPFTFGGCYWMERKNIIYVVREWEKCTTEIAHTSSAWYDHRYYLENLPIGSIIRPIGKEYWPHFKKAIANKNIPYEIFLSLPFYITEDKATLPDNLLINL